MTVYTQNAQQVLKDGKHYADCHSADDAAEIVAAMNITQGLKIQIDTHTRLGKARERQFARCREDRDTQPSRIAAHLDAEIAKRPRARAFTQGIAYARNEILAGMWREDEVAPEGVRAQYNDQVVK